MKSTRPLLLALCLLALGVTSCIDTEITPVDKAGFITNKDLTEMGFPVDEGEEKFKKRVLFGHGTIENSFTTGEDAGNPGFISTNIFLERGALKSKVNYEINTRAFKIGFGGTLVARQDAPGWGTDEVFFDLYSEQGVNTGVYYAGYKKGLFVMYTIAGYGFDEGDFNQLALPKLKALEAEYGQGYWKTE